MYSIKVRVGEPSTCGYVQDSISIEYRTPSLSEEFKYESAEFIAQKAIDTFNRIESAKRNNANK